MAMEIAIWPVLVIVAVILEIVIYMKTKSIRIAGCVLEAILGLVAVVMSLMFLMFTDKILTICVSLLGFGLLLNGALELLEK